MRGRRGDPPQDQKDKAHHKRKSKVDRFIEAAEERARTIADAVSRAGDVFAPPSFMDGSLYADVRAIWVWGARRLHERNLLDELDLFSFAGFCIYQAEFIAADADVRKNGAWFMAKATAGGKRPWKNPAVEMRDTAFDYCLDLSKRFGFSPLDRAELERIHAGLAGGDWGPLGRSAGQGSEETAEPDERASHIGSFDSAPPGRPN